MPRPLLVWFPSTPTAPEPAACPSTPRRPEVRNPNGPAPPNTPTLVTLVAFTPNPLGLLAWIPSPEPEPIARRPTALGPEPSALTPTAVPFAWTPVSPCP